MRHRNFCLGLIVGACCLVQCGCETTKPWHRKKDSADDEKAVKAVESGASQMQSVDSDDKKSEPFFKGNRKSGGWSSEAREVESSLGVN
jgi:hypothetical protein